MKRMVIHMSRAGECANLADRITTAITPKHLWQAMPKLQG